MQKQFRRLVREALTRLKVTQTEFGELLDPPVDQSTVSRWLKGSKASHEYVMAVQAIARKAGIPVNGESVDGKVFNIQDERSIPLRGHVGAGAMIFMVDSGESPGEVEFVDVPSGFGEVEAVRVRGDSMFPAYRDGDLLLYERSREPVDRLIGRECVVRIADDRWMVKVIERGSAAGLYHLLSHNASPIRDARIVEATPVRYVIRA